MRDPVAGHAALAIALFFACQAKADDPCLPARATGNAIIDLANLMGQQQRTQECATLRAAQWAAYNAHQKSLQETQGAGAARPQTAQVEQAGKVGGTVPVPPNPPSLSGDNPQNALRMMTGALATLRELRAVYAIAPRPRMTQPYPP
jgi:hypothetical protein